MTKNNDIDVLVITNILSLFHVSSVFWYDQKRSQNELAHFMWYEMIFPDLMWSLVIISGFGDLKWLFVISCDPNK